MFLTIAVLGTGVMGCRAKAASVNSIYSALKAKSGLKNAKQWMVINEKEHGYLVLASRTNAKNFETDKVSIVNAITGGGDVSADTDYNMYHVIKSEDGTIDVKAVNVDPRDSDSTFFEPIFEPSKLNSIANSVQIYNTLRGIAETIE